MLRLGLLLLIIFQFGTAKGQIISIRESGSEIPLEFVNIAVPKSKLLIHTNSKGEADISSFKGQEKIEIRLFGYIQVTKSYSQLQSEGFLVYIEASEINLQQAVVSATKWSQSRQEVPSRITTITSEERNLLNPQTAADLLGISGEVFVQKSQQGGGSPMIRGFSTNRLLYTVDGVRMNTAIFRSGNLHNVISLDPFATESTEVFFGPGSIIYGSDAIGAVMSFQTLQAQIAERKYLSGNVTLRTSTANSEKTGHVHLKYGSKKWAGVTSISSHNFDDLKMGSHGPEEFLRPTYVVTENNQDILVENPNPKIQVPSGYNQLNLMQKIRFAPNQKWDFQYGFHYSETSTFSRYDRLIRFRPNGQPRSAEWKYGPQSWMMNHLKISHTSDTKAFDQVTLNLALQKFGESRIDRNFNDPIRRTRTEEVMAYSANLDFLKTFPKNAKLFYGLELIQNDVQSTGQDENINFGEISVGPARYPDATWKSYAAYGSYQKKLTSKSLIQAGLRYNYFGLKADFSNNMDFYPFPFEQSNNRESALTANTGWVYTPAPDWTVHVNASTGFRAPNVDDIGKVFDSEPGTVMVPNPDLEAEYAYNLELNMGKVFGDWMMIDLTGYFTHLDNALVRRAYNLNGMDSILYDGEMSKVLALQNAAFVRILGLQAALEIKLPMNLTFSSRLNLQKGTEETDDGSQSPTRHAPPTFGVSRLEYRKEKLTVQLFSEYSGGFSFEQLPLEERGKPELYAIDANGTPYSPSWATLNLKGMYQTHKHLTISAGFENITDIRFRTYSSGIAAPGRNFILSLMANF
ncbi:TonB-dependent receptor plug domain-containing protein [Aquiflexum gelatinilyticum]|uniref:TonB-dependent receptor plug domain-containing protein n=1 Tax=Aquiflexum gelatinilyticum TaxID=2961943 RepID=UPI002167BD0C|nr:TonB-dependent receptor [Aquiflexum gelatinilyticum]MCS4436627.1 TonB-dependent receptor [Aquiflexum gelatinilyticum]